MVLSGNIDVYMLKKHGCPVLGRTYVCVRVFPFSLIGTGYKISLSCHIPCVPREIYLQSIGYMRQDAIDFVRCRKHSQRFGNEEAKTTSAGVA